MVPITLSHIHLFLTPLVTLLHQKLFLTLSIDGVWEYEDDEILTLLDFDYISNLFVP